MTRANRNPKKAKRQRDDSRLWSLDTEDDSKGTVELIDFYDGGEHFTFDTRDEALSWLRKQKTTMQIWCTNLGYDLVNLFGEWISLLEITYIGSRVIAARIDGTQIHFRDTLNHWKISVAEMGKRIGHEKLEGDLFENRAKVTKAKLVARCQRDAEITWKFVNEMKVRYEKIGAKLKATIGSTALDYYYQEFGVRPGRRLFKDRDIEFMLAGYYGGRTEIFFNRPVEGRIQYYDFNSLYPAVCASEVYPNLRKFKRTKKPNIQTAEGLVDARVSSPAFMSVPYLPYRDTSGTLLFPLGTFRGRWTYFEIREALKIGYKLEKVYTALEFTAGTIRPFEKYVTTLYEKRMEAQRSKDELMSDTFKLLMNNLYGKFAQGNEITKLLPPTAKSKHGDVKFGGMILRKDKGEYPEHTNVIWSAYVTAYGRHKVWNAMREVEAAGGLLIYCDTDSIIFESSKTIFADSKKLGDLKSEGKFEYAWFKLPKLYKLVESKGSTKYRAKGVPRKVADVFFETGKARFERPLKLKETMRRNLSPKRKVKLVPNVWEFHEKEVSKVYDKRIVETAGFTRPHKIVRGKRSVLGNAVTAAEFAARSGRTPGGRQPRSAKH